MKKSVFEIKQGELRNNSMKRLFRIFELSKNEQRVVLIVMFVLITVAFVGYERRIHSVHLRPPPPPGAKTTPSPAEIEQAQ